MILFSILLYNIIKFIIISALEKNQKLDVLTDFSNFNIIIPFNWTCVN